VDLPMLTGKFCSFFTTSLLARGWGWGVGGEKLTIKLISAQLELDLGLSLAILQTMEISTIINSLNSIEMANTRNQWILIGERVCKSSSSSN
jgi:hypothetical protein